MRKFLAILISVILIILLGISASAHGGKTDSNGGHYNRSTGEYHYHHGYPAHQHTNGECPYDFDDKTNHNGGGTKNNSSKSSTTSSNKVKAEKKIPLVWQWVIVIAMFILPVAFGIFFVIFVDFLELLSKIKEKWQNRRRLSKRERIDLFLFWLRIFSFVASIVGIVFFFIKPIITLFCSIVTVLLSIFDCIWGEQTNFNTEIATIIIAIVICCFTHTPIFYGIGFALCITEFLFSLIGYISLWIKLRKK